MLANAKGSSPRKHCKYVCLGKYSLMPTHARGSSHNAENAENTENAENAENSEHSERG